jgi:hypothetical protein
LRRLQAARIGRLMDNRRYLAYKSALRALERKDSELLDGHERERLRDTAEALLLTSDPDDAEPLRRDAAIALSLLVLQRRWDALSADVMWHAISDCGPRDAVASVPRLRAMTFAGAL